MKAFFVRHGESTANVGTPSAEIGTPGLTSNGWEQARAVANYWADEPGLIVTSSYARSQETAKPTRERFPSALVEIWPIHEFSYLEPSRWNGTRREDRLPSIEKYWQNADPSYCDGSGAESFSHLLRRAESVLDRLQESGAAVTYLFSHAQFMDAVRLTLRDRWADDQTKMKIFLKDPPFRNGALMGLRLGSKTWRIDDSIAEITMI